MTCGLILVVAMVGSTAVFGQSWTPLASGTVENLNSIGSGSSVDCWVVGNGGFVALAADCTTFNTVPVGAGVADLTSLTQGSFPDIWVGGENGVVRRQILGSWEVRDIPGAGSTGETFFLFSRSSGAAWAVGDLGSVYQNATGAADGWEISTSAGVPLYGGTGFVGSTATIVGASGLILETTNGGTTWSTLTSGTSVDLYDFSPGPGGSLLVVGDHGTILKSVDGGLTWQPKTTNTELALRALSTSGQNNAFMLAVGDRGVILRSTDGGETWCFLHATLDHLRGVTMMTNSTALVVGDHGAILRTDDGGGSCQSAPLDVVFKDGFESGNVAMWSSSAP